MDLILYRQEYSENGIFGIIGDFKTLEHAYPISPIGYAPKVPPGTYKCVLGAHRLHSMSQDFMTFEVTGVPNCTGILFHWGNWNKDSEGCILLGTNREGDMVINSKVAFAKFMKLQEGLTEFNLNIL